MPDTAVQSAPAQTVAPWALMPCTLDNGPAANVAIGLVALATDLVIEPELYTFLPRDSIGVYSSRIPMAPVLTVQALNDMEKDLTKVAAGILPDDKVDVMAFGCTSGSMAIGPDKVRDHIQKAKPGLPVTNPVTASIEGLRKLGAKRIALITPYPDHVNAVVEKFVASNGFDIVARGSFKRHGDPEICRIPPEDIYRAGVALGKADVDALFLSCTALRCSSVIQRIEDEIGKPVVTSNQALAWHCMRLGGYMKPVKGFGKLMTI
jgi:maleate isomerase